MRDTAQQRADAIRAEREAAGTLGKVKPAATQVVKGPRSATTEVTVVGCDDHDTALAVALEAAGETRDSLFGWRVGPVLDDGARRVELHTD